MCWYIQYVSSRCGHNIHKKPFCVGICSDFLELGIHPSLHDWTGTIPDCPDPEAIVWDIKNWCYNCWRDDPSKKWLDPLNPRIEYMLEEEAPAFDAYNWYVDQMPLNPDMNFRDINWNPDAGKVSEANADEEPVSPSTLLPEIPAPSASFRKSIMTAANRISIVAKSNARPQVQDDTEDLADKFPIPPASSRQDKVLDAAGACNSSKITAPPPIPPRHTGRVLIIPHTATAKAVTASPSPATAVPSTTPPPRKRKLEITTISPTSHNITLASEPVIALDATDPLLASTLQRGQNARETRTHLRTIRDSPVPAHQRAKVVAETRVRLEEMGKGSSATFKGGLRFKPTKVRRNKNGEMNAVKFEGEHLLDQLRSDEVQRFGGVA